jgi:membrane-associated HD superfamily phosphohydrolase
VKKDSWPKLSTNPVHRYWHAFLESSPRQYVLDFVAIFVLIFFLLLMVRHPTRFQSLPEWKENQIAQYTVLVPMTTEIMDRASTLREREKLLKKVPVVLNYNPKIYFQMIQAWRQAVREARSIPLKNRNLRVLRFAQALQNFLKLSDEDFKWLMWVNYDINFEKSILQSFSSLVDFKIVDGEVDFEGGVDLNYLESTKKEKLRGAALGKVVSLEEMQKNILNPESLNDKWKFLSFADKLNLANLHARMLVKNCEVNVAETEKNRKESLVTLRPLLKKLYRGEVIIREGERLTKEHDELLSALRAREEVSFQWHKLFAETLFAAFALTVFLIFVRKYFPNFLRNNKDLLTSWVGVCRLIRGEFMKHKEREYVQAARSLGASNSRRIFIHILPNVTHLIIINF